MDARDRILAIDGMTQAHADALISLGLDTYYEIHRLLPTLLVTKFEAAVAAGTLSQPVDLETVARWQKSALRLSLTRFVQVQVESHRMRVPLAGATVTAGDRTGTTDESGAVWLDGVRTDVTSISVACPGYYDLTAQLDLRPDKLHQLRVRLDPSRSGGRDPVYLSEYDGYLLEVSSRDHMRSRNRSQRTARRCASPAEPHP